MREEAPSSVGSAAGAEPLAEPEAVGRMEAEPELNTLEPTELIAESTAEGRASETEGTADSETLGTVEQSQKDDLKVTTYDWATAPAAKKREAATMVNCIFKMLKGWA
jgi:hypothetical protein